MRFCTIGLVAWFATWYTAEVLNGQTQIPRNTPPAEVRVLEQQPSLFEGAGDRLLRSQPTADMSASTHGGSIEPIVAPAVAFEIRSPGAIRMAVANESGNGSSTNPIRRVRLEEPVARLAQSTGRLSSKQRTAGGAWVAQNEPNPRPTENDLLNELLELPQEDSPVLEPSQPAVPDEPVEPTEQTDPTEPTESPETPDFTTPQDVLGDDQQLDRLPREFSEEYAVPPVDASDVVPNVDIPGPLNAAGEELAPEPPEFPIDDDLPADQQLPPLDRGKLDIDFPPAGGGADGERGSPPVPEQAGAERDLTIPPEPSNALGDRKSSEPRRQYRSGMDPDYLNPKPQQQQMPAATLSALLQDPSDMPDPCEPMYCQQIWDCAGGRYQTRSALMMRNWARNYQVIWSNRCNQCGGYTCGSGNTGARNLCGPALGSMCGVGLWRDGCGHHGRHHSVTCGGGTIGCTGDCGAPGCSTMVESCSGGCTSGSCQHGSTMRGLQPCQCGHHVERPAPWRAWELLWGSHDPRIQIGGWTSAGYHSRANGLFNDHPHRFNVHQSALYIERATDTTRHGIDFGFRFDVMYGADAQNTQAFGNTPGTWDFRNGFDHGIFGWALPQAYVELAAGDVSLMVGHFYTIMGYEVVPAPDNFFYSHAMTMNLSEPFTHTGALASWTPSEYLTWYSGWTLGWDTGFDEFNGGSNYLGGFRFELLDFMSASYTTSFGDFGRRGSGYAHSVVLATQLPNQWGYVVQSDVLRVGDEDNVGVNQYLFYDLSPRVGLGARLEWWKGDRVTGYAPYGSTLPGSGSFSYYGATFGANFRIGSNIVIRPESRLDWSPGLDYSRGTGAIDMVMSY